MFPPVVALERCVMDAEFKVEPPQQGTQFEWRFRRIPPGSHATIPEERSAAPHVVLDLYGYYELEANAQGADAGAAWSCFIMHLPAHQLAVQLHWALPDTDFDIHLVRESGDGGFDLESDNDCYFSNCRTTGQIDWDSTSVGGEGGEPLLLADVSDGYGPEIILLQQPLPGRYKVVAHYYSDHGNGDSPATLGLFVPGGLAAQFRSMVAPSQEWEVAIIDWPAVEQEEVCITGVADNAETCVPACQRFGTCAQCGVNGAGCGNDTRCVEELGVCLPQAEYCTTGADCEGELSCQPVSASCVVPECNQNDDCGTARQCQPQNLVCQVEPAQCEEAEEPNDWPSEATPLVGQEGVYHVESALCRGNEDVFVFSADAGKMVSVRAFLGGNAGLRVSVSDASGVVFATEGAVYGDAELTTTANESGNLYVRLALLDPLEDLYPYTLDVTVQDSPCVHDSGEPNDTLEQAQQSPVTTGSSRRGLCSPDDVDHHAFQPGALMGVRVELQGSFDAEAELLDESGTVLDSGFLALTFQSSAEPAPLIIAVRAIASASTSNFPLLYSLEITEEPLPLCYTVEGEPNGIAQRAVQIGQGDVISTSCDNSDKDYYQFTLDDTADVDLTLSHGQEVDLDVYLLQLTSTGGEEFLGSGASSANPERMLVTGLGAGAYFVQVTPYSFGSTASPAEYTLTLAGSHIAPVSSAGASSSASSTAAASSTGSGSSGGSAATSSSAASSSSSGG
jgi:hypothetical protein